MASRPLCPQTFEAFKQSFTSTWPQLGRNGTHVLPEAKLEELVSWAFQNAMAASFAAPYRAANAGVAASSEQPPTGLPPSASFSQMVALFSRPAAPPAPDQFFGGTGTATLYHLPTADRPLPEDFDWPTARNHASIFGERPQILHGVAVGDTMSGLRKEGATPASVVNRFHSRITRSSDLTNVSYTNVSVCESLTM